ncbi:MAG: DUF2240 family protein [Candidatus Methanomethylophilus sp.]|nr:DUF2240 family protein [Methanomethylophilus sp.]MDD3233109.1 DUF2240 family protein [Methanomethylophilus sp.]MDD4221682.1 DUF2240 family protein [Methanomethylophilus sp.]MDD4668480.1 DUF2240 family protein [Methanomethylophilus sp.]
MSDEAAVCTAAFFRIRGKDVVTPKEFTMTVSLDLKWMPVKEAGALMDLLLERKILTRNNGYLRPTTDLSDLQVPIAYRPSEDFRQEITARLKKPAARSKGVKPKSDGNDLFPILVQQAVAAGLAKGAFIGECNGVRKKLGINISAAALLVLRDRGINVTALCQQVYDSLTRKSA